MIPIATAISMDIQPGWAVLLICVLLTLSFFFSGTEIAFFSLQKVQRKRFEEGLAPSGRWCRSAAEAPS